MDKTNVGQKPISITEQITQIINAFPLPQKSTVFCTLPNHSVNTEFDYLYKILTIAVGNNCNMYEVYNKLSFKSRLLCICAITMHCKDIEEWKKLTDFLDDPALPRVLKILSIPNGTMIDDAFFAEYLDNVPQKPNRAREISTVDAMIGGAKYTGMDYFIDGIIEQDEMESSMTDTESDSENTQTKPDTYEDYIGAVVTRALFSEHKGGKLKYLNKYPDLQKEFAKLSDCNSAATMIKTILGDDEWGAPNFCLSEQIIDNLLNKSDNSGLGYIIPASATHFESLFKNCGSLTVQTNMVLKIMLAQYTYAKFDNILFPPPKPNEDFPISGYRVHEICNRLCKCFGNEELAHISAFIRKLATGLPDELVVIDNFDNETISYKKLVERQLMVAVGNYMAERQLTVAVDNCTDDYAKNDGSFFFKVAVDILKESVDAAAICVSRVNVEYPTNAMLDEFEKFVESVDALNTDFKEIHICPPNTDLNIVNVTYKCFADIVQKICTENPGCLEQVPKILDIFTKSETLKICSHFYDFAFHPKAYSLRGIPDEIIQESSSAALRAIKALADDMPKVIDISKAYAKKEIGKVSRFIDSLPYRAEDDVSHIEKDTYTEPKGRFIGFLNNIMRMTGKDFNEAYKYIFDIDKNYKKFKCWAEDTVSKLPYKRLYFTTSDGPVTNVDDYWNLPGYKNDMPASKFIALVENACGTKAVVDEMFAPEPYHRGRMEYFYIVNDRVCQAKAYTDSDRIERINHVSYIESPIDAVDKRLNSATSPKKTEWENRESAVRIIYTADYDFVKAHIKSEEVTKDILRCMYNGELRRDNVLISKLKTESKLST